MTWEEALNTIAGAVDVSAYDEELNTIRETMSNYNSDQNLQTELNSVNQKLSEMETAYSDLQSKYRKRFGEMLSDNASQIEEKETKMTERPADGKPISFADLSLTAETE